MAKTRVATASIEFTAEDAKFLRSLRNIHQENKQLGGSFRELARETQAAFGTQLEQRANAAVQAIKAVGGATKLTDDEAKKHLRTLDQWIAKSKALGKDVPDGILSTRAALANVNTEAAKTPGTFQSIGASAVKMAGALGLAFSAQAIIGFTKSVFDAAGNIDDLSKKIGVSREAVQRWSYAAEQSGASIDTVDKAVTKMNQKLAEGDKSTIGALKQAGLSFDAIRQMKPEDAFNAIVASIEKIEDPMQQADVALKLFGKTGVELLPAINEGFANTAAAARVMSDETIQRLDAAGDAWVKFTNIATIYTGEFLGYAMGVAEDWIGTIDRMAGSWQKFAQGVQILLEGSKRGPAGLNEALKLIAALQTAEQGQGSGSKKDPKTEEEERRRRVAAILAEAKANAEAEAAERKATKAREERLAIENKIAQAKIPLTEAQKKEIENLLKLGIAESDIAKILKVSEARVKEYAGAWKATETTLKRIAEQTLPTLKRSVQDAVRALPFSLNPGSATLGEALPFLRNPVIASPSTFPLVQSLTDEWSKLMADDGTLARMAIAWAKKTGQKAGEDGGKEMARGWTTAFGEISAILARFTDGIVGAFASAANQIINVFEQIRANPNLSRAQGASAAAGYAMDLWNSTGQPGQSTAGSTASGAAGGFGTGAMIGTYVFPGVGTLVGGLIGAGIGGLVGYFRGRDANNEHKKVNDARDEFLSQFGGDGTGAGSGFGELSRQLAVLGPAGRQLFQNVINARTMEDFERATRAVTAALEGTRAEMARIAEQGGVAGRSVIAWRDGMRDTAEVKEFITKETQTAQRSLTAYLQAGAAGYKRLAELQKEYANATGEERDRIAEDIERQKKIIGATGIKTQAGATAVGSALFATFQGRQDQGVPIREALAEIQPAVAAFQAQLDATWFSGGEAFAQIAHMAGIATGEITGPALEGIGMLTRGIEALHNAGLLTQEMFTGLTGEIMANRQTLIDQGVSAEDANRLMQRDLQTLWQLQKDYGYQVDESTQALLDEAEAAGLVGDQYRSAMDRAAIAMERAANAIINAFGGAGEAVDEFSDKVDRATRPRTVRIDVEEGEAPRASHDEPYSGPAPSHAHRGGFVRPWGIAQYLARGGTAFRSIFGWPKGTDTVPTWLTPGEFVMNARATDYIGHNALAAINANPTILRGGGSMGGAATPAAQPITVAVTVNGDVPNRDVARTLGKKIARELKRGGDLLDTWRRDAVPFLVPRTT